MCERKKCYWAWLATFFMVVALCLGMKFTVQAAGEAIDLEKDGYSLKLERDTYTYNGILYFANSLGNLSIYKGDDLVSIGSDKYTVEGDTATNAGTHTLIVKGVEEQGYTGSISVDWYILPAELNEDDFELTIDSTSNSIPEYEYTGSPIKPGVTLKTEGSTTISSSDYLITYDNNIDVGTVTLKLTGRNNYTGSLTRNFKIIPYDLENSNPNVTLDPITMEYTGEELKPKVSITMGQFSNSPILDPANYDLEYSNNINVTKGTSVTAQVKITGKNNSKGTLIRYFNINKINPYLKIGDTILDRNNSSMNLKLEYMESIPISTNGKNGITTRNSYLSLDDDNTLRATKLCNNAYVNVSVNDGDMTNKLSCSLFCTVVPKEITDDMVTLKENTVIYDGQEQKPVPVLCYKDQILKERTDYTLSYENNVDAGKATLTITGKGNYQGSITKEFDILPYDLEQCEVELERNEFVYEFGASFEPQVTVYMDQASGKILADNSYFISYSKQDRPGDGVVTIFGDGKNCVGTKSVNFTILKGDAFISLDGPSKIISIGETTRVKIDNDIGYVEVSSRDPNIAEINSSSEIVGKHAGTTSIYVNYYGGEYFNDQTIELELKVLPFDLSDYNTEVTLDTDHYVYDGTAKTPEVSVTYEGSLLEKDKDYEVIYKNNINAGSKTDGQTGPCVEIQGLNDYEGFIIVPFTIEKLTPEISLEKDELIFGETTKVNLVGDGKVTYDLRGSMVVTVGDNNEIYGTQENVVYAINAGTATIYASMAEGKNYKAASKELHIKVLPKSAEDAEVILSKSQYTYSGAECKPEVTVQLGNAQLLPEIDYDLEYSDHIMVNGEENTPSVKVVTKGNYHGTITKTFDILPYDLADATIKLSETSYPYNGDEYCPDVKLYTDAEEKNEIPLPAYQIKYENNIEPGTAKVLIASNDRNYTGEKSATFVINKIKPSYSIEKKAIGIGQASPIKLVEGDVKPTLTSENTDILAVDQDKCIGVHAGKTKIHVKFAEGKHYSSLEETVEIEVLPYDLEDGKGSLSITPSTFVYDGKEKKPEATVKYDGKTLVADKDYDVSYQGNVNISSQTSVPRVKITGKGDYKGGLKATFEITKPASQPSPNPQPNQNSQAKPDSQISPAEQKNINSIKDILGVTEKEAVAISNVTKTYRVSKNTIKINDKLLLKRKNDADLPGSSFMGLKANIAKAGKNNLVVKWSRVSGADGYILYGSKCGKNNVLKKVKTLGSAATSYNVKKLKKGTYYKYLLVAYKKAGNVKVTIASSPYLHGITKGGKYGMAKAVKITKIGKNKKKVNAVTLAKDKKVRIYSTEVKQDKTIKKHRGICYQTSNAAIAKVSSNGTVTAVKKGKCTIYVYAQNGKYKTVKVTVK